MALHGMATTQVSASNLRKGIDNEESSRMLKAKATKASKSSKSTKASKSSKSNKSSKASKSSKATKAPGVLPSDEPSLRPSDEPSELPSILPTLGDSFVTVAAFRIFGTCTVTNEIQDALIRGVEKSVPDKFNGVIEIKEGASGGDCSSSRRKLLINRFLVDQTIEVEAKATITSKYDAKTIVRELQANQEIVNNELGEGQSLDSIAYVSPSDEP
eukprot:scaffold535_cov225-Chaetoceros_neogracile.AAC.9